MQQGFEVYLPVRFVDLREDPNGKVREIEPLFPGYLFCELASEGQDWHPIRSTPGVLYIVGFGRPPQPAKVPVGVVEALMAAETAEGVHGGVRDYAPGDIVRLTEGPLQWYEAVVRERTSGGRIAILMNIMGAQTPMTVSRRDIEPAEDR